LLEREALEFYLFLLEERERERERRHTLVPATKGDCGREDLLEALDMQGAST
jgi:hypothetical protein